MYKRPCKWAALFIGACWGKLEGVCLLGLLREKENAYLGSFSLIKRTLTLCLSYLNPYCLGRIAAFFSVGI
jgi:hypothetical protein